MQLHRFYKQYIIGSIRSDVIDVSGIDRSLDAWRIMADRGNSQSSEALHDRLSKITTTRKTVAAKDLEKAIANWEHDIEVYRRAKPTYVMDGDLQRMLLMQLCPPQLLMYLRLQKAEILEDYHKLKTNILPG